MKHLSSLTILFAVILTSTCCFFSCRELAQNGDFSGQWQILSIDYPDGTTVNPAGTRYYCIYRDVAQLTAPDGIRVTGNLIYDEDSGRFSIQFPYAVGDDLSPWGITFPDTTDPDATYLTANFTINELTSSRLVMTTEAGTVITCRKW